MNDLRARMAINKTGKIVDKAQAAAAKASVSHGDQGINLDELNSHIADSVRDDLEHVSRETILKFIQTPMDQEFVFKVAKNEGPNYIQAMRQILSRARKKAKRAKQKLQYFKMIEKSIITKDDHDEVTLLRTQNMTAHESSIYDTLIQEIKL